MCSIHFKVSRPWRFERNFATFMKKYSIILLLRLFPRLNKPSLRSTNLLYLLCAHKPSLRSTNLCDYQTYSTLKKTFLAPNKPSLCSSRNLLFAQQTFFVLKKPILCFKKTFSVPNKPSPHSNLLCASVYY